MEFIIGSLLLMELIVSMATGIGIPPEVVLAIIEVESGGNPFVTAFNQAAQANITLKRPALCSVNMEAVHQRTAWGLMQVMGSTARGVGFCGWLTELTDAETNIGIGMKYLGQLKERFFESRGLDGVIAAYNRGAPRKSPDGKFVNQGYVDRVKALMPKYEAIVQTYLKERGEDAKEGVTDKLDVTEGEKASDNPAGGEGEPPSEPAVASSREAELSEMELDELRIIAKEVGLKPPANIGKAKLVAQILAALAADAPVSEPEAS